MDTNHSTSVKPRITRQDKKVHQKEGRLVKQASRISSRPRKDSATTSNKKREGFKSKQSRPVIYDVASPNPVLTNGRLTTEVSTTGRILRDEPKPTQDTHPRLSNAKHPIHIGNWNVRTLLATGKLDLLVNEIDKLNWDIVGVAETRWKGKGMVDLERGRKCICSGASKQGQAGVGVLLNDSAYGSLISYDTVNERIISIRCRGQGPNLTLFQVYAPTSTCSEEDIEDFYNILQAKVESVPKQDVLIIAGDWNAKVGQDFVTWSPTIGKHGYGSMNDRGERILHFCKENKLIVTNTYFKHKASRKWTWISPDHKTRNMIDFIRPCMAFWFVRCLATIWCPWKTNQHH